MSQVNIQNLLQMSPIGPEQVQQTPVNYKESSFSGGGFTPGKMAALPAKTSEQYMYESLSQIASGVQQGLSTFADISERIDREKINETETKWEEIDALDIDPREKVKQFNLYVNKVSTPMSGDLWKKRIANRMAKSWGQDAYEKFVADEYIEQAKAWKEYDGKMGPVLTDRFLTEFEKNNPSLTGSNFLQSLRLQTNKQLENIQDQLVSNSLVTSLVNTYSLPSDLVKGLSEGTTDFSQMEKIYPEASRFVQLATTASNFDDFTRIMAADFYSPIAVQIENFNPEVQLDIKLKLDQIFPSIVKDIWEKSSIIKQADIKRSQQALALSANSSFISAPNENTFFEFGKQSAIVLSNMSEMDQIQYLSGMYQTTYKGLASGKVPGQENFIDLPPSKQIEIVSTEFKALLEKSKIFDTLKTTYFPAFKDKGKLLEFITTNFKESQEGQALQSSVLTRVEARAQEIAQKLELDPNIPIETAMGRFIEEVSVATGVDGSIVKDFLFSPTGFSTETLEETSKRNPKLVEEFYKAGFTPHSLRAMSKSIVSIKEQYDKRTTGAKPATSLKEQKYQTEAEARQRLLVDTDEQRKAMAIVKNPSILEGLSEEARNDALMLVEATTKANIETRHVANQIVIENLKLTEKERKLLETEGPLSSEDQLKKQDLLEKVNTKATEMFGQSLDTIEAFDPQNSVNFNTFFENTWVDPQSKNITQQGRLMGIRAAYYAREMAQNVGISGREEFLKNLSNLVTGLNSGEVPFNQQNPGQVYGAIFMLRGLSFADQTQVTSFISQSKADHTIGTQFIRYLATKATPSNLTLTDEATTEFLNVMEIATKALSGGETLGQVLDVQQGKTIGVFELANRYMGYSTGNLRNAYPEVKEYERTQHTNNAVKAMGQALGFGDKDPKTTLRNLYTFLSPLFSPGSGLQSTIIPSPDYAGDIYVNLPHYSSPKKFSSLSDDDKLVYYLSVAGNTDYNQLKLSISLAIVANNTLRDRKKTNILESPEARINAVSALTTAGLAFNEVRRVSYNTPHQDIQFLPSFIGLTGRQWGPNVLNSTPQSMIPSLPFQNNNERKNPSYILPVVTRQILGTSHFPSFEEVAKEVEKSPNPADVTMLEEFKKRFNTPTVMEARSGVRKGLNPASQFIVGIASLPATTENIDYFLSTISDSTINNLEELEIPKSKITSFYTIPENRDKPILQAIKEIDSSAYEKVATVIKDMRLGLDPNGITFTTNIDRSVAVLEFNQVRYDPNSNDDYVERVSSSIAIDLPPIDYIKSDSPLLFKNGSRYLRTMLLIDDIQDPKEKFEYKPKFNTESKQPSSGLGAREL